MIGQCIETRTDRFHGGSATQQLEAGVTAVTIRIRGLTGPPEISLMRRRILNEEVVVVRGSVGVDRHELRI